MEKTLQEMTREQQIEALKKSFIRQAPALLQVGVLYHRQYPAETTHPDVLRAVTVPVPLPQFNTMMGLLSILYGEDIKSSIMPKEKAVEGTEVKG